PKHTSRTLCCNLQLLPGEPSSNVVVNLVDSSNQSFDVPAEDIRSVPNFDFVQVIFRLPNNLAVGTCIVKVKAHGQVTNSASIRIRAIIYLTNQLQFARILPSWQTKRPQKRCNKQLFTSRILRIA